MADRPLILAVDRNRRNLELLSELLGKQGYETLLATNLADFDRVLGRSEKIAMALVDLGGFDESIWDCCDRLREVEIPFFVILPRAVPNVQGASLAHGAKGTLVKPLAVQELLSVIRSILGG